MFLTSSSLLCVCVCVCAAQLHPLVKQTHRPTSHDSEVEQDGGESLAV